MTRNAFAFADKNIDTKEEHWGYVYDPKWIALDIVTAGAARLLFNRLAYGKANPSAADLDGHNGPRSLPPGGKKPATKTPPAGKNPGKGGGRGAPSGKNGAGGKPKSGAGNKAGTTGGRGAGTNTPKGQFKVTQELTAEEVNSWWKTEKGYDHPPYKPGTTVTQIELTETSTFVRVYDGEVSRMHGGWVMKADDIAGMSPQQIRNKFALPSTPKYICDVELPAGTQLRTGITNEVPGWGSGGGTQYDLMGQRTGNFYNERRLP